MDDADERDFDSFYERFDRIIEPRRNIEVVDGELKPPANPRINRCVDCIFCRIRSFDPVKAMRIDSINGWFYCAFIEVNAGEGYANVVNERRIACKAYINDGIFRVLRYSKDPGMLIRNMAKARYEELRGGKKFSDRSPKCP